MRTITAMLEVQAEAGEDPSTDCQPSRAGLGRDAFGKTTPASPACPASAQYDENETIAFDRVAATEPPASAHWGII